MHRRANRIAAAVVAALALLCIAWLLYTRRETGAQALIWVDGEVERTVSLRHDQSFRLTTPEGHLLSFEVKNGRIRFVSSDCPDKICVNTGFIGTPTQTAVCMPNRVSITIRDP